MIQHNEVGERHCHAHGEYTALSIYGVETGCPACLTERMAAERADNAKQFTAEHKLSKKATALSMANIPPR